MTKLVKSFLIFFILNGAIIFFLERKYQNYQNTYDFIFKNVDKNKNLYTDVYIGNSHTEALKEYTNKENCNILNIATPGQDLFKTYTILKKWMPILKNVKYIYIGIDYEMLGQNLSLSGLAYEDRQLFKYTDTLYLNGIENLLMAKSSFFRSNRDIKFLFFKQDTNSLKNFTPPVFKLNDVDCKKRALEHSQIRFKKTLINENLDFLNRIIKDAEINNKKLIFFNPPKSACFVENALVENVTFAKNKLDSLFKKNNLVYYDYNNDTSFLDTDFLDYDHVNELGKIKLIKKINSQVFNN